MDYTNERMAAVIDSYIHDEVHRHILNVTSTAIITVPRGCCYTIAVENTSAGLTAADPSPAILVKNANLTVTRIA